ncbi:colanic acid biosynthesis protein WcaM, partial [Escherichia coli]|nr:colanic acid biosynthesis protein WcaM [Escherichia coli]
MSENKLSRRTFLTAVSALAVLHFPVVRALESTVSVNIQDYNPNDWVASFRQAFKEGQTVVVPKGLECKDINTAIVIPPGKTLSVQG